MPARGDRGLHPLARVLAGAMLAAATLAPAAQAQGTAGSPGQGAQSPRWPTSQDLEDARRQHPFPTPATTDAAPRPLPRIATGAGLAAAPASSTPRPAVDLAALARQGSALASGLPGSGSDAGQDPGLRIFVTLQMPPASLQRLVEQAERAGAVLVLRGLKNQSMRQTLAAVAALLGSRRVAWTIDPEAFERHGVQVAPTFVLTLPDPNAAATPTTADVDPASCRATGGCVPSRPFVAVAGDVSLDHALEFIARQQPAAAARAGVYRRRLPPS